MASSLISGLIRAGHPASELRVAEALVERAEDLKRRFAVSVSSRAADILAGADTIVIAVKPQQMKTALAGLKPDTGATVISIAAGIPIHSLRAQLGPELHYVRCMPNTPALVGAGISGLYADPAVPKQSRDQADSILRAAGEVCWVDQEQELDAVTAVSGSGPAYFFLVVEAMREAGEQLGLSAEVSARLAAQTCVGAARMIELGEQDVAQLRANVTSPGGTTAAAVDTLEKSGIRRIFQQALQAAADRSAELGRPQASSKRS